MAETMTCTLPAGTAASADAQQATRLCDAVASRLPPDAAAGAELVVLHSSANSLRARLSVIRDGQRIETPEMGTTVIDRNSLPEDAVSRLAATLVTGVTKTE